MLTRPKILILSDYYLPGYKGGGPIRSVSNMIDQLNDMFDFTVITRDHDLGDRTPYSSISQTNSHQVGRCLICYQSKRELSSKGICKLLDGVDYDLLYLNSFFRLFSL